MTSYISLKPGGFYILWLDPQPKPYGVFQQYSIWLRADSTPAYAGGKYLVGGTAGIECLEGINKWVEQTDDVLFEIWGLKLYTLALTATTAHFE